MRKHNEGLRMSLVDESNLDSQGILIGAPTGGRIAALPDTSVQLFLLVAAAGSHGLAKSRLPSALKNRLPEVLLPLELENLVSIERDNRGHPAYIVLTWYGQEALEAARPARQKAKNVASQRRASLCS